MSPHDADFFTLFLAGVAFGFSTALLFSIHQSLKMRQRLFELFGRDVMADLDGEDQK